MDYIHKLCELGVETGLKQIIAQAGDDWLKEHCIVEFGKLHNEPFEETPADHPAVTIFQHACSKIGLGDDLSGFIVSCDTRLFANLANMPTIGFGPGSLSFAHSDNEHIETGDILTAAKTLISFVEQ